MPSFDIVSKLNLQEVDNAIHQAQKEIATRFDFKETFTELSRDNMSISLKSITEDRLRAALEVLQGKFIKRGVSLRSMEIGEAEPTAKGHYKQLITLIEGVAQEKAKNIVKAIKDAKLKVQASIQGDSVRVSGKDKDELQKTITFVKSQNFPIELQFINFRD